MKHRFTAFSWSVACLAFVVPTVVAAPLSEPAPPVVAAPQIPAFTVKLTDFGAVADGRTLNTAAFAAAIDAVAAKGGGRVVIPPGLWRTGPIVLKSRVALHAERGALVQFSDNRDDYPLIETYYEGRTAWRCQSPLSGRDLEDVALTGEGVFDGAGEVWRPVKKEKLTARQWDQLVASGGVVNQRGVIWYPSAAALAGNEGGEGRRASGREGAAAVKDALRPVMLSLINCRRVLLENITVQNSPAWCIHPLLCEDVTLRRVTVRNAWFSQNGDGLDLESCRNALVEQCSFDVGDDAICMKSGRDAEGRKRGKPTENVLIRDCIVYHGHGGFVVGSEMSGGVRNIIVRDCTFMGTDVGLRFKSTRGRGGVVENIHVSGISMTKIPTEPILFDLFYGGAGPTDEDAEPAGDAAKARTAPAIPPVTEATPAFRNIVLRDIVCRGAKRAALLRGLPEMPLQNIRLENVTIEGAATGIEVGDATGLVLDRVRVGVGKGSALSIRDGQDITVTGFAGTGGSAPTVKVTGARTRAVSLRGPGTPAGAVASAPEVPAGAVRVE
jgi:polygalacturonase